MRRFSDLTLQFLKVFETMPRGTVSQVIQALARKRIVCSNDKAGKTLSYLYATGRISRLPAKEVCPITGRFCTVWCRLPESPPP